MKALTLTQPWATLVAIGAKRIETRSWPTKYRGQVAIHAAKGWPADCKKLVFTWPFDEVLQVGLGFESTSVWSALAIQSLPVGAILATATIINCIPTQKVPVSLLHPMPSERNVYEKQFGDYEPGRWAWILDNVRALKIPISCKGALGLWEVSAETAEGIAREAFL